MIYKAFIYLGLQTVCHHHLPEINPQVCGVCQLNTQRQQVATRNSSGDEIANVNFLYDDIVHVLVQSTAPSPNCTTRHSYTANALISTKHQVQR